MVVTQYIAGLPEKQKQIMTILRSLILDVSRDVKESMHEEWQEPVFYLHGALCYLSIDDSGVAINFYHGKHLTKKFELLELHDRKQIASYTFYGVTALQEHEEEVRQWLTTAATIVRKKDNHA
ncbi:MAG: hypothetical protein ACK57K_12450 [Chryseotalea sp.]|jgi:hypothetical protein|nr:hypothetical protein [Cytophagales bacterium]